MHLASSHHHDHKAWIPWAFVVVFIPVIAVNVLLIRMALSSNTGLVTDHAFDTGQGYNAVIAAGARQQALGWQAAIDVQPAPLPDAPHRVALTIGMADQSGLPLKGLTIAGRVTSPVDPQPDIDAVLVENAGGRYRQQLSLPRAGQWELQLVVSDGTSQYAIQQRLTAP